jgi:hypothetical protein
MRDPEEAIGRLVRIGGTKTFEERIGGMCRQSGVSEKGFRSGSQGRRVSEVTTEIACYLSREMGISMAETARKLGVETFGVVKMCGKIKPHFS